MPSGAGEYGIHIITCEISETYKVLQLRAWFHLSLSSWYVSLEYIIEVEDGF